MNKQETEHILYKLYEHFNVDNDNELANSIGVFRSSIIFWRLINRVPTRVLLRYSDIIYNHQNNIQHNKKNPLLNRDFNTTIEKPPKYFSNVRVFNGRRKIKTLPNIRSPRMMPDGQIGIVYKKKVYPINNNRINIKKHFYSISECPFYYYSNKRISI